MHQRNVQTLVLFLSLCFFGHSSSQEKKLFRVSTSEIGYGWSKTSVNATVFRKNSLVTHGKHQFAAYYDSLGFVVLAKRMSGSNQWEVKRTQYKGNVKDAHNIISIMVDGQGFVHMAWDHHNNRLHYCIGKAPLSLEMGEEQGMIGQNEKVVSYPEFYRLNNGDILFAYRDGGSGNGNLVINRFDSNSRSWKRLHDNLIDGEKVRNAYWQICVGKNSDVHVSWVWRETPDVASNHDMCYARSLDGGMTWERSDGEKYTLPITASTAEYVMKIPQKSNLINQTSMTVDSRGKPCIATYFKAQESDITQFYLIYRYKGLWRLSCMTNRKSDFDLSGAGSRSIPVSRPQIVCTSRFLDGERLYVIYRDEEHGNKVCMASGKLKESICWTNTVIGDESVDRWEPSFDTTLWQEKGKLNLFVQRVGQGQAETMVDMGHQMVKVMEVRIP